MQSVTDFISRAQLSMTLTRVPFNPHMDDKDWKGARHWAYVIKREGFGSLPAMRGFFSQGSAHKKAPTIVDVLGCLAMDARGVYSQSFEEWASECGYDPDSRKAFKTFEVISHQLSELRATLGRELLDILLAEIELD